MASKSVKIRTFSAQITNFSGEFGQALGNAGFCYSYFWTFTNIQGKSSPYLDFCPGMGSVFLSAAQDDVEKDEDGQLHCQNDPFQIHHR